MHAVFIASEANELSDDDLYLSPDGLYDRNTVLVPAI